MVARTFDASYSGITVSAPNGSRLAVPSTHWSGLTEQLISIGATPAHAGNFRITEFNYNPHDPTALELAADLNVGNDDLEFAELTNISDELIYSHVFLSGTVIITPSSREYG